MKIFDNFNITHTQIASGNNAGILSPSLISSVLNFSMLNINSTQNQDNQKFKIEIFEDFHNLVSLDDQGIQEWIKSHLHIKKVWENALRNAMIEYKTTPGETTFLVAAVIARVVIKCALLYPRDRIDESLLYKVERDEFQDGKALPLFIILTKKLYDNYSNNFLYEVEQKLPRWDVENFDWDTYMTGRFNIPDWSQENVDLAQANCAWKDDLSLAIIGAGKLSYNPEVDTLKSLQEILLRLKARLRIIKTKKNDDLALKIKKKSRSIFYSVEEESSQCLLKRYAFILAPPFLSYEEKKIKLKEQMLRFSTDLNRGS